jgi:hypothetical protein
VQGWAWLSHGLGLVIGWVGVGHGLGLAGLGHGWARPLSVWARPWAGQCWAMHSAALVLAMDCAGILLGLGWTNAGLSWAICYSEPLAGPWVSLG